MNALMEIRDDGFSHIIWGQRALSALQRGLPVLCISDNADGNVEYIGTGDDCPHVSQFGLTEFPQFRILNLGRKENDAAQTMEVLAQALIQSAKDTIVMWNADVLSLHRWLNPEHQHQLEQLLVSTELRHIFVSFTDIYPVAPHHLRWLSALKITRWEGRGLEFAIDRSNAEEVFGEAFQHLKQTIQRIRKGEIKKVWGIDGAYPWTALLPHSAMTTLLQCNYREIRQQLNEYLLFSDTPFL